jgi:mono/diheme cytochrome c family protein
MGKIYAFIAVMVVAMCSIAAAQQKEIKHVNVKPTLASSGKEMYMSYCAVCHGKDAKGNGPAAEALKVPPTDLTLLAQKNGGKFPSAHVTSVLRGQASPAAHGSADMPVWGPLFWQMGGGHETEVTLRISNLSKYLESLQAK